MSFWFLIERTEEKLIHISWWYSSSCCFFLGTSFGLLWWCDTSFLFCTMLIFHSSHWFSNISNSRLITVCLSWLACCISSLDEWSQLKASFWLLQSISIFFWGISKLLSHYWGPACFLRCLCTLSYILRITHPYDFKQARMWISLVFQRSSKLAFVELVMDTEDELVMLRIRSKPGCVPCFPWTFVPGEYFICVHSSLPVTVFKNVIL